MIEIHPEFQYSSFLLEPCERLAVGLFLQPGDFCLCKTELDSNLRVRAS